MSTDMGMREKRKGHRDKVRGRWAYNEGGIARGKEDACTHHEREAQGHQCNSHAGTRTSLSHGPSSACEAGQGLLEALVVDERA